MLYGEPRIFFADRREQDGKGPEELRRDAAEWHRRRAPLMARACEERAARLDPSDPPKTPPPTHKKEDGP